MCDVMTKGPNDLLSQNASQLFVNTWFLVGACNRLSMDFIMTSSGAEFTHWCSLWDIHVAPLSLIQMLSPGRGATCHAFCSACPLPLPCFGEWWSIVVPLHISIRQALKTKCLGIVSRNGGRKAETSDSAHEVVQPPWLRALCRPLQHISSGGATPLLRSLGNTFELDVSYIDIYVYNIYTYFFVC